jgi:hypothetical protein
MPRYKSQNRFKKELDCGCYYFKAKYSWHFSPQCEKHVKEDKEKWRVRPWYSKLAVYVQMGFVGAIMVIGIGCGLFICGAIVYSLLYVIYKSIFP